MTCVIVNDASCLIDLRKGGLLGVVCDLPYRLVIPLPVRASEELDLSEAEWQVLDEAGMITHDLTPEEVGQAFVVKERHPGPLLAAYARVVSRRDRCATVSHVVEH